MVGKTRKQAFLELLRKNFIKLYTPSTERERNEEQEARNTERLLSFHQRLNEHRKS